MHINNKEGNVCMKYDRWKLTIENELVTRNIRKAVYDYIWIDKAKEYWKNKWRVPNDLQDSIDWETFIRTNKNITQEKRTWRTKHMANIGSVGEVLFRRKHRDTYQCPMCSSLESNTHLLVCTSQDSVMLFNEMMDDIKKWLDKMVPGDISNAIMELMISYHEGREPEIEKLLWNNGGWALI